MPDPKKHIPIRIVAEIRADSYNETDNTIDVIFTTGERGLRQLWDGTKFYEELEVSDKAIRMDRLKLGAPFLNDHMPLGIENVLGRTVNPRIETVAGKSQGVVTIKLATRDEVKGLIQDIRAGIICNVSVGYKRHAYREELRPNDGDVPTRIFTDWEPVEVSSTTVPYDKFSQTRSLEKEDEPFFTNPQGDKRTMVTDENGNPVQTEGNASATPEKEPVQTRSDKEPQSVPVKQNPAPADDSAVRAERQRVKDIREAVRAAKLPESFADSLIDNGTDLNEARRLVIVEFSKNDPAAGTRGAHNFKPGAQDETEIIHRAIEGAVLYRLDNTRKLEGRAGEFVHDTMLDLAKRCMDLRGNSYRGMSRGEIVSRALTTTDYPILLGNIIRTRLRGLYDIQPNTWRPIAVQDNAVDFKEKTAMQFGGTVTFDEIKEMGEYKFASLKEAKETWKIATFGKMIGISRQAIINDELGGFNRVAATYARAAADMEAKIVWALLLSNAGVGKVMADGKNVFHTDHANKAASGGALSETTLSAGRLAMRKQTGMDSNETLNLFPQYLIIPPELELTAQKLLAAVLATKTGDVNVFANSLTPIVEPRLSVVSLTAWMLATNQVEGIVYSYLEGQQGLYTETENGFDVDGVKMKARLDFGAGILDYRGFYRNAGA